MSDPEISVDSQSGGRSSHPHRQRWKANRQQAIYMHLCDVPVLVLRLSANTNRWAYHLDVPLVLVGGVPPRPRDDIPLVHLAPLSGAAGDSPLAPTTAVGGGVDVAGGGEAAAGGTSPPACRAASRSRHPPALGAPTPTPPAEGGGVDAAGAEGSCRLIPAPLVRSARLRSASASRSCCLLIFSKSAARSASRLALASAILASCSR